MKPRTTTTRTRAQSLRKSSTDAELRLWRVLRNRNLEKFKFRRQHPIGPYIVDFVCLEKKLVIELDGGQHVERASYDAVRSAVLAQSGFRVIRFWDNDVLTKTESVMQAIYNALGCPAP